VRAGVVKHAARVAFARRDAVLSTFFGRQWIVRRRFMPFVIAEPCIGVKDKSCVEVCPVNCIYEGEDQYYIHPDECIDCQACEAACPVQAIFPDNGVPEKWLSFTAKNREYFQKK